LRTESQAIGIPVDRLRKEAAFHRLLVRFQVASSDKWALKGGMALIARLGEQVRATKDADVNWRADRTELDDILTAVEDLDLYDWFSFEIADPRRLQGETEPGALRYPVTARLAGRLFEQLSLDVNIVGTDDPRPIEIVTAQRNPFAFVDEPPLQIPMVTPAQQLAEKLHAYIRLYGIETSSRPKDIFDMLLIAEQIRLPVAGELTAAVKETFHLRATSWPPNLGEPPSAWARPWLAFVRDYPVRWPDLAAAFGALREFWHPILTEAVTSQAVWKPDEWRWG
jgi:hypothetical protein